MSGVALTVSFLCSPWLPVSDGFLEKPSSNGGRCGSISSGFCHWVGDFGEGGKWDIICELVN